MDETTRKSLRHKALEVVEFISLAEMGQGETELEKLWAMIYKIVHVGNSQCTNPHEDWKELLEETWQELCGDYPYNSDEGR